MDLNIINGMRSTKYSPKNIDLFKKIGLRKGLYTIHLLIVLEYLVEIFLIINEILGENYLM